MVSPSVRPVTPDDPLMTTSELADYLRRPAGTFRQWRHRGYDGSGFPGADQALVWMRARVPEAPADAKPRDLYRALARHYHPDAGGDPDDWDDLDQARQLLDMVGLL